ncbi:TIGR00180 family glycosyltransferase [Paraglaciecola sp.]|uniref:TIGR00180 family glycosyltransferase n=1 Tax=Paraglaciecola sp. TaxID=1920173 RepID=UPI003266A99F
MTTDISKLLTIVIPIYQRLGNVERLCRYYASLGCDIVVADNSEVALEKPENLDFVTWVANPKWKFFEKYAQVFEDINTPYVLPCADDDFVVKESIYKGVDYLEANRDVVLVNGYHARFRTIEDNAVAFYPSEVVLSNKHSNRHILKLINDNFSCNDPWERVAYNLKHIGGIDYSLYRTPVAQAAYSMVKNNSQFWPINCTPFIICFVVAALGNIRYLPELWLLKNMGERIISNANRSYPSYLQKDFSFCDSLSDIDFSPINAFIQSKNIALPVGYHAHFIQSLFDKMCSRRGLDKSTYESLFSNGVFQYDETQLKSELKGVRHYIRKFSE